MKTFLLACNVLLPISLVGVVLLFIFGPMIERQLTPERRQALVTGVENVMASSVEASVPKDAQKFLQPEQFFGRGPLLKSFIVADVPSTKPLVIPPVSPQVQDDSKAKPRTKERCGKKADSARIKFFPAEISAGLRESFHSQWAVDSSIWKPSYGWPSTREIKWLTYKSWGEYAKALCDYFKISDCYDIIMAISVHESSASPWAINDSSGATGLLQLVFNTADFVAAAKECGIPREFLNRGRPEQNIFVAIVLFKKNLKIFKDRGYQNCRDWAIMAHYSGAGAAEDSVRNYGGLYQTPFYQSIMALAKLNSSPAPVWAQNLWAREDWRTVENIRHLAGGMPPKRVKLAARPEKKEVDFAELF
jgi:hypothetical protein